MDFKIGKKAWDYDLEEGTKVRIKYLPEKQTTRFGLTNRLSVFDARTASHTGPGIMPPARFSRCGAPPGAPFGAATNLLVPLFQSTQSYRAVTPSVRSGSAREDRLISLFIFHM